MLWREFTAKVYTWGSEVDETNPCSRCQEVTGGDMSDSESSDVMHVSSTTDAREEGERRDALETGYRSGDQFARSFAELDSLRGLEKLCDVVLVAGSERIPAHRVILASLSPYFRAMFTGEMAESRKKEIVINGVEPSALVSLVVYAYTAFVKLSESNVQSLLAAASALQFDEVRDAASQFLMRHLDAENCLGIKQFAEAHGCKQLHSAAEVYAAHWFSDVCKREEYRSLPLSDVVPFLSNHRLNVESEYVVFKAALCWLNHNRSERTEHLYEVMRCVRFPLLTEDQLLKEVGRNSTFIGNPRCVELMVEALQHRLLPETKKQVTSLPSHSILYIAISLSFPVIAIHTLGFCADWFQNHSCIKLSVEKKRGVSRIIIKLRELVMGESMAMSMFSCWNAYCAIFLSLPLRCVCLRLCASLTSSEP